MVRVQPGSIASSARAGSVARAIVKKRDKPYKTEQSRVLERKKKLNLQTTFNAAPSGFQFLPVGTPDLADRCKELSRLRGLPVNIVNTDPLNKSGKDTNKISHHILRVGYHFRSEVVRDACNDLGYIYVRGKYVKATEHAQQSILARTMMNHGLRPVPGAGLDSQQESSEQIRAAVKELFPKIPEDDLEYIMRHAWAEGANRVGTAKLLTLPRRVQLATIARIRHHYTDYDRLLKAFDWKQARLEVEPACVAKLLEWRGENEETGDDEVEEIVREVIVIDDDDEEDGNIDGLDRQSSVENSDSDDTVHISYRRANDEDLGAERHDPRTMSILNRYETDAARSRRRDLDVRHRIGEIRQQLRNPPDRSGPPLVVGAVHVPTDQIGNDTIIVDGRVFRRAAPPAHRSLSVQPVSQQSLRHDQRLSHASRSGHRTSIDVALHDRPVASIESQDGVDRSPYENGRHIVTRLETLQHAPRGQNDEAIRRSAYTFRDPQADDVRHRPLPMLVDLTNTPQRHLGLVDLTAESPSHHIHRRFVDLTTEEHASASYPEARQIVSFPDPMASAHPEVRGPVDAQVAPVQYVQLRPRDLSQGSAPLRSARLRPIHPETVAQPLRLVPVPVHGAPAPVQQMSRPAPQHGRPAMLPHEQHLYRVRR